MRIGYPHPDRLISYPDPHNLSIWRQPIRMRSRRRHRWTILEGNALGRAWLRCPWAAAGPGWASRRRITTQHRRRRRCGGRRRVRRAQEGLAAVPVGGGGAWPDNEPTRRATHQRPGAAGVEGAGGSGGRKRAWPRCRWAAAGPGRTTSRRAEPRISDQAPPVWRAPEGPEGTGGLRDRPLRAKLACGDLAGGRTRRRPEHQRRHKHHRTKKPQNSS